MTVSSCNFEKAISEVKEAFFGKDAIINTVRCIAAEQSDRCQDPITDVIIMMMKTPFSPALTDIGFMPFSLCPTHVIPYTLVTKKQLETLIEMCKAFSISSRYISCNQMGGGIFVGCINNIPEGKYMIDPALAIFACNVIIECNIENDFKEDSETSVIISNVILQRILAGVNVPRERIIEANEMKKEWIRQKISSQRESTKIKAT